MVVIYKMIKSFFFLNLKFNYFGIIIIKIPGMGYYYSGFTRRKSMVTVLASTLISISIVSIQVFILYML